MRLSIHFLNSNWMAKFPFGNTRDLFLFPLSLPFERRNHCFSCIGMAKVIKASPLGNDDLYYGVWTCRWPLGNDDLWTRISVYFLSLCLSICLSDTDPLSNEKDGSYLICICAHVKFHANQITYICILQYDIWWNESKEWIYNYGKTIKIERFRNNHRHQMHHNNHNNDNDDDINDNENNDNNNENENKQKWQQRQQQQQQPWCDQFSTFADVGSPFTDFGF